MFYSLQIDQDQDQIPPGFSKIIDQKILKNSIKIIECKGLLKLNNRKKSQLCSKFSLYEEYIVIQASDKKFLFQIDLTITFQANLIKKNILFKDGEKQIQFQIQLYEQKKFQILYHHLKRSLFQTNFNEKYQIQQKVGNGKTSIVYKAFEKCQNKIYAAKFYSKVRIIQLSFFQIPSLIKNQINILKQLEHPNLIYLHEMFLIQGQIYLIMDYQDGGNLLDKISQDKFMNMKEKIKFFTDMLNAFQFLRINGIIHRDLKPENILYSEKEGNYKIADFQMAIYQNQPINKLVGTAGYLAPELFIVQKQTIYSNLLSDIYSLGLIYYELATKQTYFKGQSVQILLKKNKEAKSLKKKKYSKDHISDAQYEILRMMIRKQPENRSLSIQILQSSQLRKIIKDLLQKSLSKSSSTQSPNKSSKQYEEDGDWQDNFIFTVKKIILKERNSQ